MTVDASVSLFPDDQLKKFLGLRVRFDRPVVTVGTTCCDFGAVALACRFSARATRLEYATAFLASLASAAESRRLSEIGLSEIVKKLD